MEIITELELLKKEDFIDNITILVAENSFTPVINLYFKDDTQYTIKTSATKMADNPEQIISDLKNVIHEHKNKIRKKKIENLISST